MCTRTRQSGASGLASPTFELFAGMVEFGLAASADEDPHGHRCPHGTHLAPRAMAAGSPGCGARHRQHHGGRRLSRSVQGGSCSAAIAGRFAVDRYCGRPWCRTPPNDQNNVEGGRETCNMQHDPPAHLAGKSTAYDYLKSAPDSAWAGNSRAATRWCSAALAARPPAERADEFADRARNAGSRNIGHPMGILGAMTMQPARHRPWVESGRRARRPARRRRSRRATRFGGAVLDLARNALPKTLVRISTASSAWLLAMACGVCSWRSLAHRSRIPWRSLSTPSFRNIGRHRQLRLLRMFSRLARHGHCAGELFSCRIRAAHAMRSCWKPWTAISPASRIAISPSAFMAYARVERDWSDPRREYARHCPPGHRAGDFHHGTRLSGFLPLGSASRSR